MHHGIKAHRYALMLKLFKFPIEFSWKLSLDNSVQRVLLFLHFHLQKPHKTIMCRFH